MSDGTLRDTGGRVAAPRAKRKVQMTLRVNGEDHDVAFLPHRPLLEVLREDMGLTGTKHGCELGECGTCTVIVDGEPALSCLLLAVECEGRAITTVEGLSTAKGPHPLQTAFADLSSSPPTPSGGTSSRSGSTRRFPATRQLDLARRYRQTGDRLSSG